MVKRFKVRLIAVIFLLFGVIAFRTFDVNALAEQEKRNYVEVVVRRKSYIYYDEVVESTNHLVEEQIFRRKINASPQKKMEEVCLHTHKGIGVDKALIYSYPRLKEFVDEIKKSSFVAPIDAKVEFNPSRSPVFTLYADKAGESVDEQALYQAIYRLWHTGLGGKIEVKTQKIEPSFTLDDAKKQTFLRGKFTTDYSNSAENRKHNVALALSKINGYKLKAGDSFSFNSIVGRRNEKNGYKQAKIISNGDYVDGFGGGVCQVSTTLYNAVILSDLRVDEVNGHSLAPSYVSPSFDAMVNSGHSDLVFTNTTHSPVYIKAVCDGSKITVEIFGEQNPYEIVRESVIVKRGAVPNDKIIVDEEGKFVSEQMQSGEQMRVRGALAGMTSEGYLYYYEQGRLVEKRAIRKDNYQPLQGIIAKKP